MGLIKCRDCSEAVSKEAAACPHCGAPQQLSVPPPLPGQPPVIQSEAIIYSDNTVAVTSARISIGGTTYSLRNIASVRMAFTPPQVGLAFLFLLLGIFVLLLTTIPLNANNYNPIAGIILSCPIIVGSIIWMCCLKSKYHVDLSSVSGEIHLLTSKNKEYIQRVVLSINEAIQKYH
jgi:Family of unknown function (DUF6232)